ncbi:SMP-30/gluconolactonase/LRE family protein [Agrobacterium sp.]|uniref:SMP-30/gluconolactonase/LRE family protein n=1 Tax=Agrobacterium sp. TaxID=361 RepID=UPI0028AA16C3|nr:SMP-30/gluconolactonase/LRE family protein [Agrobacterium sp.]
MATTHPFSGKILDETALQLGEGPTYDAATDTAWWFNILGKELHELQLTSGRKTVHKLPFMASVLARIDDERQLIASEHGLFLRQIATGELTHHADFEPGMPGNRSNDGRVHASGALWIGTMGKSAEDGAGGIYHVANGTVTTLFDNISIPNSICFSPNGTTAYYTDTKVNRLMSVAVDPATGLPIAKPSILVDASDDEAGIDGSVCDKNGDIWNAKWGAGSVARYSASGQLLERYSVPGLQTTCPAFIGKNADRLLVTSAFDGMADAGLAPDALQGATFDLGIEVNGVHDFAYRLS